MTPYRTVFTRESLDFICRTGDDEMSELDAWFNRIERQPGLLGDYAELDQAGRNLQVKVLHQTVVTYWTDDAVREVRVVRIEPNP